MTIDMKAYAIDFMTEIGFDEEAVVVKTGLGTLIIQGQGLQLKQLSQEGGQVGVEGEISALVYERGGPQRSFWGRLLG